MSKLDECNRYNIPNSLITASMFKIDSKVNVIYENGELLLKQDSTRYGVDKIIDIVTISSKGRITLSKHVRELFDINKETTLFSWFEPPGIIHIEKKTRI